MGKLLSVPSASKGVAATVESLLQRSDLLPSLRVQLWTIFWFLNKPNPTNVSAFLEDIWAIQQIQERHNRVWRSLSFASTWPLLALTVERQQIEGSEAVDPLLLCLDENKQLSVAKQVEEAIQEFLEQADETQKNNFL